jgi:hypothetical protein
MRAPARGAAGPACRSGGDGCGAMGDEVWDGWGNAMGTRCGTGGGMRWGRGVGRVGERDGGRGAPWTGAARCGQGGADSAARPDAATLWRARRMEKRGADGDVRRRVRLCGGWRSKCGAFQQLIEQLPVETTATLWRAIWRCAWQRRCCAGPPAALCWAAADDVPDGAHTRVCACAGGPLERPSRAPTRRRLLTTIRSPWAS